MADAQPPTIVEGATTGDIDDEIPIAAKSAEDRKAAAALSSLSTHNDESSTSNQTDSESLRKAIDRLQVSAATNGTTGKKEEEKKTVKKTFKADPAAVSYLVRSSPAVDFVIPEFLGGQLILFFATDFGRWFNLLSSVEKTLCIDAAQHNLMAEFFKTQKSRGTLEHCEAMRVWFAHAGVKDTPYYKLRREAMAYFMRRHMVTFTPPVNSIRRHIGSSTKSICSSRLYLMRRRMVTPVNSMRRQIGSFSKSHRFMPFDLIPSCLFKERKRGDEDLETSPSIRVVPPKSPLRSGQELQNLSGAPRQTARITALPPPAVPAVAVDPIPSKEDEGMSQSSLKILTPPRSANLLAKFYNASECGLEEFWFEMWQISLR